jgi:hypothetical protein
VLVLPISSTLDLIKDRKHGLPQINWKCYRTPISFSTGESFFQYLGRC